MRKEKKQNKIPKSFFIALIAALFFWLLTKLSKEYEAVISFPVEYVGLPQDKLIQSTPLAKIDILVKASGFKLFVTSLFKQKINLDASKLQRKKHSEYFFLIRNQRIEIRNQVSSNLIINNIAQDTIYLNLGQLATKKIPLIGNFDFSYLSGYHLVNPINISPDSILVSGSIDQIDTLQFMQLEKLSLKDISASISQTLKIKEVEKSTIKFDTKVAEIYGEVDRFTEGSIEIPFEIINLPENISVNTFSKSIELIYQIGLTNYNKININSFKVVCDYEYSVNNNLNYLIPKVILKPEFVISVKLIPNKIEYLIQKE